MLLKIGLLLAVQIFLEFESAESLLFIDPLETVTWITKFNESTYNNKRVCTREFRRINYRFLKRLSREFDKLENWKDPGLHPELLSYKPALDKLNKVTGNRIQYLHQTEDAMMSLLNSAENWAFVDPNIMLPSKTLRQSYQMLVQLLTNVGSKSSDMISIVIPGNTENLFDTLNKDIRETRDATCDDNQSAQQRIYLEYYSLLYFELLSITAKVHLMLKMFWYARDVGMDSKLPESDLNLRISNYVDPFLRHFKSYTNAAHKALGESSRIIATCDIQTHKEDETFYKLQVAPTPDKLNADAKSTVQLISLMDQQSDIKSNKIVTGVKFTKVGRMLLLQIEESSLLPSGNASNSTWKVPDVKYNGNGEYSKLDGTRLSPDIHFSHLMDGNVVELGDVEVPVNHVLTGIKLVKLQSGSITLEIQATKFDFLGGKLNSTEESRWISAEMSNPRTELKVPGGDPLAAGHHTLDSTGNQFIKLQSSASPLIDALKVTAFPKFPLAGVGLYHKGAKNSAGFIAPRIITHDITQYFKTLN